MYKRQGEDKLTNDGCDIVFDHVGFAYDGGETVLRDVSFTAKQGEVTALIGPSGGGKTTVSRLAARFWDVGRGSIKVGGMDVSNIDPETLMSLYSIVFQDVTLFDNSILENIRIGLFPVYQYPVELQCFGRVLFAEMEIGNSHQ